MGAGDEQDFFEKVMRTVALDEGHDEVRPGLCGGGSDGHAGTLAEVGVVPEVEVGLGEIPGFDDAPLVLLDGCPDGLREAFEAGLGRGDGGEGYEGGAENPLSDAHGDQHLLLRADSPYTVWVSKKGSGYRRMATELIGSAAWCDGYH